MGRKLLQLPRPCIRSLAKDKKTKNTNPQGTWSPATSSRPRHKSYRWYDAGMNTEILKRTLAWSAVINYVILIIWFVAFFAAHDWLFSLHGRFGFRLSAEQFDFAHYLGMAIYKLGIMLFNLVP